MQIQIATCNAACFKDGESLMQQCKAEGFAKVMADYVRQNRWVVALRAG